METDRRIPTDGLVLRGFYNAITLVTFTFFIYLITQNLETLKFSGDLNSKLVGYSDHGDLLARRMVRYLDAWYHGCSVISSPFG